jgi:hypothetical protein
MQDSMTNPHITIKKTTAQHIGEMALVMQEQSAEIARKMGCDPKKLLWQSYRRSFMCKSVFINGKIAAIFGISGVLYGETGQPWLIMSDEVNNYPFKVAFIYRKELEKFQNMFPVLEDYVDESNEKAIRMLELMKFNVSKNIIPFGEANLRRAERRV